MQKLTPYPKNKHLMLITGTGRLVEFDKSLYQNAVKHVAKQFKMKYTQSKSQVIYNLVTLDVYKKHPDYNFPTSKNIDGYRLVKYVQSKEIS